MPPPAILADLDAVVPGLAREVADEFRAEAKHRRKIESRASWSDVAGLLIGYVLAGLYAVGCFAVIWHAIDEKAYGAAAVLAATALVGGVVSFLGVRKKPTAVEDDELDT